MKYSCIECDYHSANKNNYEKHLMTAKHKNCKKSKQKIAKKYHCLDCDYIACRKQDYEKHLMTAKHFVAQKKAKEATVIDMSIITDNPIEEIEKPHCHVNDSETSTITKTHKLIIKLLEQNNDLQKQIIELSKEPMIINNNYYTTNNSQTNQFNLHVFLNETCKNALNFSEFIDNIQISYDDLENNAKLGFVSGITNVIVENLKQLELNHRPIHCTDVKRETIYVKEEDQWEKDHSKEVIEKGIQELTRKNMCSLSEWREENPDYEDMESELGEQSMVMQQNSMAGVKRDDFYPKIIKNIAKETILDKNNMIVE